MAKISSWKTPKIERWADKYEINKFLKVRNKKTKNIIKSFKPYKSDVLYVKLYGVRENNKRDQVLVRLSHLSTGIPTDGRTPIIKEPAPRPKILAVFRHRVKNVPLSRIGELNLT